MSKTQVALFGAGFIADLHMESFERFVPDAEVTAVYARNPAKAEAFAAKHHIPRWYADVDALLREAPCEVADICLPNFLHAPVAVKAARAGKHVIVEKPLCMTLEEADEMIRVCREEQRLLMYGEQLCFSPKYERVRQVVGEGAVGDVYQLRQLEKHSGPHGDWFWDVDQAGGGVLMDMGCHAFGWFRWMLGAGARVSSVYASMGTVMHGHRTRGEDNVVAIVEFDNGVTAIAEDSWAKPGGMDDRIEVYGQTGVIYADLFRGNSALTYSEHGYGYAAEKAGSSQGWTFTIFEEAFNQGYPQELGHFVRCVRTGKTPLVTGEDGRAVLEMVYAAYDSARRGAKVALPFSAAVGKPIDLWWQAP
jgi:myo-inositol 2-dehydrogenase / D-chiro-inositol 1-dehydrogenase